MKARGDALLGICPNPSTNSRQSPAGLDASPLPDAKTPAQLSAEEFGDRPSPWGFIDPDSRAFAEVTSRGGLRIRWPSIMDGEGGDGGQVGRTIQSQSSKSRMRCAFAFGQSVADWGFTSLLTFPHDPAAAEVERAWRSLRRRWRDRWGETIDAWVMEFTRRGRVHFHLFHAAGSNFGVACSVAARIEVGSRKKRTVLRGGVDWWIRDAWLSATRSEPDSAAARLCGGGMIEPMRSPDAAGRYVSKEAGKRFQKQLPAAYREGLGRYWFLAPRWAPKIIGEMEVLWQDWPWESPMKHVFNGAEIEHLLR